MKNGNEKAERERMKTAWVPLFRRLTKGTEVINSRTRKQPIRISAVALSYCFSSRFFASRSKEINFT